MEYEHWTAVQKLQFCPGGRIDKIECVTSDGDIPSYSSGEMLTCYPDSGLVCRNADNFPVPCSDYKIRYHCECRESCVQYDTWVNVGHNTPGSTGDREPIDKVKELSLNCQNPLKIQCQTVGGVAYDQTGQIVSCNLWKGLTCNNMDQFNPTGCLDYRVRLGCLKQTPECVPMPNNNLHKTVAPVLNPHVVPCFEGLDTSQCPNCSAGLYCDGMRCVKKADCTCQYNNKIIMKSDIITTDMCETCQCYSGELRCVPKSCPPCSTGETKVVNMTSCSCSCKSCDANQFRCGNGQCIPASSKCDGVIDCDNDEVGCLVQPHFTPPSIPTLSPVPGSHVVPVHKSTPFHDGHQTHTKPQTCHSRWSGWMNSHHPGDPGSHGDHEPSAAEFSKTNNFCTSGSITKVECYSVSMDAPAESSGEILTCTPDRGLICDDSDNFPIPCGDYKIRYFCACGT